MAEQQVEQTETAIREEDAQLRPALQIAELWPPQGEWDEADYFALPVTPISL